VAVGLVIIALIASPLLVPAEMRFVRIGVVCLTWTFAAKLWDCWSPSALAKMDAGGERPTRAQYLGFFAHPLVMTIEESRWLPPGTRRWPELGRLAAGAATFALGAALLRWMLATRFGSSGFLLDHTTKVVVLAVMIESGSQLACALARLAGLDVRPIVDWAVLARSPADFWHRYNRMIGAWLHKHVFIPAGGRRRYIRATALTFLLSGLGHECLFALLSGRATGYAFAFFMVQVPAVAVSAALHRRVRRPGPGLRLLGRLATIAFVLASSVLFFAAFCQIAPDFYAARCPLG